MTTILQSLNKSTRNTIARLQDDAVDLYLDSAGADLDGLDRLSRRIDHLRDDLESTAYTAIGNRIHHISLTLWQALGYDGANRHQWLGNLPSYTLDDLLSPSYDVQLPHNYTVAYLEKAVAHVVRHVPYQEREDVLHDLYVYVLHRRPSKIWYFWPCCVTWLRRWWRLYHYRQHYGRSLDQILDTDDPTIGNDRDKLTLLTATVDTCERIQDAVTAQRIYQSLPTHIREIARKRRSRKKLTGYDWLRWEAFAASDHARSLLPDL